jgi:hypothetical protein
VLASPQFLFRAETEPAGAQPGTAYRITDLDLASRLSFFLWSSIPDDTLAAVARQGRLREPQILREQVRRMLRDPRAAALSANFGGQWLALRNMETILPSYLIYPDFDDNLRHAFIQETEMFLQSVFSEDRSAMALLNADYTFLNERLAKHYGIPGVAGPQFRRVTLMDENRRGLLGQGSILTLTSHPDRTSPVVRGKWILSVILGTPPPDPPANVPQLPDTQANEAPKTVRQRLEQHRNNPVCASCHKTIDPPGFALENFDGVGAWRSVGEDGAPVDTSGVLADGTPVNGPIALRRAIERRPVVFVRHLTERLLTYALGRGLTVNEMPFVRKIVRDAASSDYQISSIILGIVESASFQMRVKNDGILASSAENHGQ